MLELIHDIRDNHVLGKCIAIDVSVEFQKRGLPHAHILVWLDTEDSCGPQTITTQSFPPNFRILLMNLSYLPWYLRT